MTSDGAKQDHLGFLTIEATQDSAGFIGGIMITARRGYPLEFRACTPIRPSAVQRVLYGTQLDHYVSVQLAGKTLVSQLARKPIAILVPNPLLLDLSNECMCDVIAIWPPGESLSRTVEGSSILTAGARDIAYQARFVDANRDSEILSFVQACASNFSLLDTFDRIRAALQLLAKEDTKFA